MNMLALTIILPLIGFVLLAFSRGRWSENVSAIVGVGSVGLAALVTAFIGVDFFANGEQAYSQPLWTWMSVGDFNIGFNLVLDGLSLTMLSVVTGVGFLIHMYASWYMRGEEGYSRFFAYTNLFIASMVVLVLADNLLLMKQLELMLTSGELNPRHQHTVTQYAKGLTCEADTLGSCGYVYLAVYPTPETKT